MNAVSTQVQDSVPPLELPLPQHARSEAFLNEWLSARGLKREWGRFDSQPAAFSIAPSFKIVTHDEQGHPQPDWSNTRVEVLPDSPRGPDGELPPKYRFPYGKVTLYASQPDSWVRWERATEKWLAEGEGKALALHGAGKAVIGFPGIQNWHAKGEKTLKNQLARRIRKDDKVFVAIDGDWRTNPNVRQGAVELLQALAVCEADAVLVDIPDVPGCAKPGVDDWIAHLRSTGTFSNSSVSTLPTKTLEDLTAPPLKLATYEDILARPAPDWIVKNVIPPGELTAIVGATSCGKTFLTMDLLLAVARNDRPEWFGHRIKRHGLVVHITLEGTSLGNRLNAYHKHHGLTHALPYVALESPINLRQSPDDLIAAIRREQAARGIPVILIAVDTVNRAMGGGEENSSEHMGSFLASAEKIKTAFPGCGVLLVHHLGKNQERGPRGHSSFSANVGAQLLVEEDEASGIRTVAMEKQRDAATNAQFSFKLTQIQLDADADGDPVTSCVVEASAPPVDSKPTDADVYKAIYFYWMTELKQQPIAKGKVKEDCTRIAGGRFKQRELQATMQWAENDGLLVQADKSNSGHPRYTLKPYDPRERKF